MKKNSIKIIFILIVASFLVNPALFAEKKASSDDFKGFPGFVESMLKDWDVPGTAIVVVKDGKIVFAEGFGYRNVEKKLKVTPDTLFAIGSCTKAFTAAALGILVDEGKLEWEKPVRDYLPTFKLQDNFASEQMTAMDLVTHRSGLPRHDPIWYGSTASREELFNRLQYLEPSKGFRAAYQYNNLMFMTAGYMAGKIAGTSWEELVRTKLFAPLGMNNSNFSVEDSQKTDDFSLPYSKRNEKITSVPFRKIDVIGPAGSINSSVNDMAKWLLLNLNNGKIGDKTIISEANLTLMHTPQMVMGGSLNVDEEFLYTAYGMGWMIDSYRGHPVVFHGGGIDGFISFVTFLPRDNAGIVVLTNSDSGGSRLSSIIAYNLYDRILKLPQVPWSKRFKERDEKAEKLGEKSKKNEDTDRKIGTTTSHPLEDYTGKFENPGYGVITIEKGGDTLKAVYNGIEYKVEHYHYDIFELSTEIFGEQKLKASFLTDLKGNINSVKFALQAGVKDIEFTRMAEKKGKEYLQRFVGEYEVSGVTLKIELKGEETLVTIVPGQPIYELIPYKDNEFTLKDLTGYTLKFVVNESGAVTAVESHQPNGTFTAKKVK
jgi:CubicO group peptidase (beta-lactamase class C family)